MPDGRPVHRYTLTNAHGLVARIIDYGATVTELHILDRGGRLGDVVLGFDELAGYLGNRDYVGCTVGRVANRIAGGRFTLEGADYRLTRNDGPHHLHGGVRGFDKALWSAEPVEEAAGVRLTHTSPDGDEGYPGRLEVTVVMTLDDDDALVIDYTATTDRATPVNLTHHAYFNLAGEGDVLGHELAIHAQAWTPTDGTRIPTGELRPTRGTALDFAVPTAIGARLNQTPGGNGYDHSFVLEETGGGREAAARVYEPRTGRAMAMTTTEPGLQLYTGNAFDGSMTGKRGVRYGRHAGLALEAQHFPDAVNQPAFPGIILHPGRTYRQTTAYRFSAR